MRSIDTAAVFLRLRDVLPSFTKELEGVAAHQISRRNEELHAGSTPFDGLPTTWLGGFYQTCTVLLEAAGENLDFLVGTEEAAFARQLIDASRDQSAQAVTKVIAAHKTDWESKDSAEQSKLEKQASVWAVRHAGHRVKCPACGNDALVAGAPVSAPIRKLDGDLIVETQDYLPSNFGCIACHLKISGLSQLTACGLGATYKSTSTYDAVEYYAPEDDYSGGSVRSFVCEAAEAFPRRRAPAVLL